MWVGGGLIISMLCMRRSSSSDRQSRSPDQPCLLVGHGVTCQFEVYPSSPIAERARPGGRLG
ncbi:hypothetical protein BaRGS_00005714, partial [Batillaria attramentaria]